MGLRVPKPELENAGLAAKVAFEADERVAGVAFNSGVPVQGSQEL